MFAPDTFTRLAVRLGRRSHSDKEETREFEDIMSTSHSQLPIWGIFPRAIGRADVCRSNWWVEMGGEPGDLSRPVVPVAVLKDSQSIAFSWLAAVLGRILAAAPLYLGFAAAGGGVALPGALLPVMMLRWHLQDEQGGRLFLLAWIGSSLGALLVRGSLRSTDRKSVV